MTLLSSEAWLWSRGPWGAKWCKNPKQQVKCSNETFVYFYSFPVNLTLSLSRPPCLSFSSGENISDGISLYRFVFFSLLHRFTVECFPWMNLNVPGFSERLIFTMGNNDEKFTLWVLLKPDVTVTTILLEVKLFTTPGITVSEDTLSAVQTFIYTYTSRRVNTDEEVNHRLGL